MAEEIQIKKWDEFRKIIKDIRSKYGKYQGNPDKTPPIFEPLSYLEKNTILFRGQKNSKWPLKTTLERKTQAGFHVSKYLTYALSCVNEIESYTGRKWATERTHEILIEWKEKQTDSFLHLPMYDYLVYLRHHGFPSPLFDWTESPFIAAFFAISEQEDDETSAVYAYIASTSKTKMYFPNGPRITLEAPFISTDKRHFSQKAWYTVATEWNEEEHEYYFCSHEEIFKYPNKLQDILIKIILPPSAKSAPFRTVIPGYSAQ